MSALDLEQEFRPRRLHVCRNPIDNEFEAFPWTLLMLMVVSWLAKKLDGYANVGPPRRWIVIVVVLVVVVVVVFVVVAVAIVAVAAKVAVVAIVAIGNGSSTGNSSKSAMVVSSMTCDVSIV